MLGLVGVEKKLGKIQEAAMTVKKKGKHMVEELQSKKQVEVQLE